GYSNLIGLEISFNRLNEVRRLGPSCAQILCSDSIPFASFHFDAVVSAAVIEHIVHPAEWLAELARVTKPQGLVSIVTDTYMWKWLKWMGLYRSIQPIDEAIWPFTLVHWAKQSGLDLIGCGGFINNPQQKHYFGNQLLKLFPGAGWLQRRLKQKRLPEIYSDERIYDLNPFDFQHEKIKTHYWACIGSYECYYWFRKH
ncbi:MAG: SAM-dependent methyltransferase, partial [Desulfobacteraceae bacterium]